jgi:hypothetical protein
VEPNSTLAPGDLLTVKWLGRSNASIILTDQIFPSSGNLEIRIGKTPYIDGNSNGYVDVSYEARRNGQPVGSSQVLQLHVGEAAELPWPLPKVVDATNGEVSTWQPVKPGTSYDSNTATVVVTDSRILAGDTVAIIWRLPGGTDLTVPWMLAGAGEGRVPVPSTVLARSLGQMVQVGYVVFRGAGADLVGNSGLINLQVAALNIGVLKAPAISEVIANTNRVDLNTFAGDAHVFIEPWPLIAAGQMFWLYAKGVFDNGSPYSVRLSAPYIVQPAELTSGIRRIVDRKQLLKLTNTSTLHLELRVDLTGDAIEASATLFPIGEFVMVTVDLDMIAPMVVGATNGILVPETIPDSGVVVQVPAYGGRSVDQWVYVEFNGQNGSREATSKRQVLDIHSVMDFVVSKSEVLKNENQAVVFEYKVGLTEAALYTTSRPVALELGDGLVHKPGVADFEDYALGQLEKTIDLGPCLLELATSNGAEPKISNVYSLPPYITGKHYEVPTPAYGYVNLLMKSPALEVKLGFAAPYEMRCRVQFEDTTYSDTTVTGSGWVILNSKSTSNRIKEVNISLSVITIRLDNIIVTI